MKAAERRAKGRLWLQDQRWNLTCTPDVAMALKRCFPKIDVENHKFVFRNTPELCFELRWFSLRYPLSIINDDVLERGAKAYEARQLELELITAEDYVPAARALALPLRPYQAVAVDLFLKQRCLLVGDDVGLGKTAIALGAMAEAECRTALVATYGHLQGQWAREARRFIPGAFAHVIKTSKPYDVREQVVTRRGDHFSVNGERLTAEEHQSWCRASGIGTSARGRVKTRYPDVLIITYTKLADWGPVLAPTLKFVCYDEIQELRKHDSAKYGASRVLAQNVPYRMGLSATPVYNYGGETFNVMEALAPGALGQWDEFAREWCGGFSDRDKAMLTDPKAMGQHLRSSHMMIRRTREEVGRQLPAVSRCTQVVDADQRGLDAVKGAAGELARIILGHDQDKRLGIDLMQASSEFITLLRRETGIAKAASVAAFVKLLLDQGEPVILGGWHHAVYEIWRELLHDYKPAFYTGKESNQQKERARHDFLCGNTNLMILSLRSGVGLTGLEARCRNVVFGELDWSPGPHKQFIGRVHRDGQKFPVFAYFLYCNSGSDPILVDVLGLKDQQQRGIENPWADDAPELLDTSAEHRARQLAQYYIDKHGDN